MAGAEQVALALVALFGDQELRLRFGLDAFGDDAQAEGVAERDGRAAHGARFVIVADFFDERAVDHDAVERAAAQLAERHVAGAEIVDEHAHALAAQLVQRREAAAARGQHLLGDLEIEMRGLDAGFAAPNWSTSSARLSAERYWRADVDRHAQLRVAALAPASRDRGRRDAAPSGRAARKVPRARRSAGIPRWAPGRGSCEASAGRLRRATISRVASSRRGW